MNDKDNYCSKCGEPLTIRRIDKYYVIDEIKNEFLFEKGYFFTLKSLLLYPSGTINSFLNNSKGRIVKPILFLFISTILYVISKDIFKYFVPSSDISTFTDFILINFALIPNEAKESVNPNSMLNDYYAYTYLFLILIMSALFTLFFKKSKYNFFEIVLMLCYIISVQLIIKLPIDLIILSNSFLSEKLLEISVFSFGGLISSIYPIWALTTFFKGKLLLRLLKVFFAYYVSFVFFILFLTLFVMLLFDVFNIT